MYSSLFHSHTSESSHIRTVQLVPLFLNCLIQTCFQTEEYHLLSLLDCDSQNLYLQVDCENFEF